MWGYPWSALLFSAAAFWIFANTAIYSPRETLFGFGIICLGFPLFWISKGLEAK
jgi:hypothetical protein